MFQQAVFGDEVSQDLERVIAVCQRFGLQGIELRSVWGHKAPQDIPDADVEKIKSMLGEAGLSVCCIASPFFKCSIDSPTEIAQHHDILRRCGELAHAFGIRLVRGFTFWRQGDYQEDRILDLYQPVVDILEAEDIVLGIENEASTFIGTGRRLAGFLDRLASDRVGAIWDACNVLYDADDPETPYPDGYQAIKPHVRHVHIKDSKPNPRGEQECCPVGEGDIDYEGQFRALFEDDYRGWVSLETHWRPVALSKEQVDKPGGADYSAGAEQASTICLQNIQRIIQKVQPR
ncbi:MAG: sugar phosphate isomerase/epimerase family protein [Candidatus Brocadiia bacterium]